jgi:hypothetical protein
MLIISSVIKDVEDVFKKISFTCISIEDSAIKNLLITYTYISIFVGDLIWGFNALFILINIAYYYCRLHQPSPRSYVFMSCRQKLFTLPGHLSPHLVFDGVHVAHVSFSVFVHANYCLILSLFIYLSIFITIFYYHISVHFDFLVDTFLIKQLTVINTLHSLKYICYRNVRYLNQVIIIKTKVLFPRT